jgi:hypothetical protein
MSMTVASDRLETTTSTGPTAAADALRRAAVRATLAPSVHNTQPWRFTLSADTLEVYADPSRQLQVLDPAGRQLLISCGCALFNARVSLAASGWHAHVDRDPEPADRNLLARITAVPVPDAIGPGPDILALLDGPIDRLHTNRRRFDDDVVPDALVEALVRAAVAEGAELMPITEPDDRVFVAVATQRADAQENADPAYRAELRRWTSVDPLREDGIATSAIPHGGSGGHDDIPLREFDTTGAGELPTETRSSMNQCLLLLGTATDTRAAWLRAGEALEHALLEIARHGYAASPITQPIEMPNIRAVLHEQLRLAMHPQILLRVGRAPRTPATRRRRLVDMLTDTA